MKMQKTLDILPELKRCHSSFFHSCIFGKIIRENHTIVTVPDQEALDVNGDVCMTVGTKFIKKIVVSLEIVPDHPPLGCRSDLPGIITRTNLGISVRIFFCFC